MYLSCLVCAQACGGGGACTHPRARQPSTDHREKAQGARLSCPPNPSQLSLTGPEPGTGLACVGECGVWCQGVMFLEGQMRREETDLGVKRKHSDVCLL